MPAARHMPPLLLFARILSSPPPISESVVYGYSYILTFNPFLPSDSITLPPTGSSSWHSDRSLLLGSTATLTSRTLHSPWCLALVGSRFSGCNTSSLDLSSPHFDLPIGADGHLEMQPRHRFYYAGNSIHYIVPLPRSPAAHRLDPITPHVTATPKDGGYTLYTPIPTLVTLLHSSSLLEPLRKSPACPTGSL